MEHDQNLASKAGRLMLHVVQPEPLTVSPAVAEAAASERTEMGVRLQRLLRRGREYYVARARYHGYHGADADQEAALHAASSRAGIAFTDACEAYFGNAAEIG